MHSIKAKLHRFLSTFSLFSSKKYFIILSRINSIKFVCRSYNFLITLWLNMRLAGDFSCAYSRGHDLKSSTMIVNCDSWSRGYQCSGNVKMTQLSCRKMTPPWTLHLLSTSSSAAGTRVLWIHPRKCPDTSLASPSTCPENWVSLRAH